MEYGLGVLRSGVATGEGSPCEAVVHCGCCRWWEVAFDFRPGKAVELLEVRRGITIAGGMADTLS